MAGYGFASNPPCGKSSVWRRRFRGRLLPPTYHSRAGPLICLNGPERPIAYGVKMERIENRTFDELRIGDTAGLVRTLTYKDIEVFAVMSGDVSPAHVDEAVAKSETFYRLVAHSMSRPIADRNRAWNGVAGSGHDLCRPVASLHPACRPRRQHHRDGEGAAKDRCRPSRGSRMPRLQSEG